MSSGQVSCCFTQCHTAVSAVDACATNHAPEAVRDVNDNNERDRKETKCEQVPPRSQCLASLSVFSTGTLFDFVNDRYGATASVGAHLATGLEKIGRQLTTTRFIHNRKRVARIGSEQFGRLNKGGTASGLLNCLNDKDRDR